jgi:hypothetical protein
MTLPEATVHPRGRIVSHWRFRWSNIRNIRGNRRYTRARRRMMIIGQAWFFLEGLLHALGDAAGTRGRI